MTRLLRLTVILLCLFALHLFALDLVSAQDQFFDSNGVRIRYVEQGSGPPVVLLHGFSGNLDASWVETGVLPKLATDYRVIALDSRGHGKSDKPHDPKSYGLQMGQDVVRLLDHLHIARAHIVGHSMGAGITAKLLTTNPDRFLTATLSGSAGRQRLDARGRRRRGSRGGRIRTGHSVPVPDPAHGPDGPAEADGRGDSGAIAAAARTQRSPRHGSPGAQSRRADLLR